MSAANVHRPPTPDLLEVLERVHAEAVRGRKMLAAGAALTGRTALRRVEEEADCAIAAYRESQEQAA